MPKGGHGRGAIAAIGLVLLFAGLVGGVVLWVLADREPEKAAESFARAAPGCTTTLTFGEAGTFYVYRELSGVAEPIEGCQPSTLPGRAFTFTITTTDGIEVARVEDTSQSYDLDAGQGTSVARITIPAPGEYRISVVGEDPAVVAAVGGDPEEGVDDLRYGAIAAAAAGVVLGGLLLLLSGRRSKRAATFSSPLDPGWGVTERDHQRRAEAAAGGDLPAPVAGQVPVNPHAPDERRVAQLGGDDGTFPAPLGAMPVDATATPAATHQPTLFDAPPANPEPTTVAGQHEEAEDEAGASTGAHVTGDDESAEAAGVDVAGDGESAETMASVDVAGDDLAGDDMTGDEEPPETVGVDVAGDDVAGDDVADAQMVGDDATGDDAVVSADDRAAVMPPDDDDAPTDAASGVATMPVAAPVPDEDVTPASGRDDADDASSDDDTPSA